MNNALKIVGLVAAASLLATPLAASAVPVSLFFNSSYVEPTDEAGNLNTDLTALGHTVSTFTGIAAADWTAAFASGVVVLPELGVAGSLNPDLDAAAKAAIAAAVSGGGQLVVTEGQDDSLGILNSVFGFALTGTSTSTTRTWTLNAGNAAGTAFAGAAGSVPSNNSTGFHATVSLPFGALSLYEDAGDTSVWAVGVGSGSVTFLGWDWFDSAGQDGGWKDLLDRAVSASTTAVPEPASAALLGMALVGFGAFKRRSAA